MALPCASNPMSALNYPLLNALPLAVRLDCQVPHFCIHHTSCGPEFASKSMILCCSTSVYLGLHRSLPTMLDREDVYQEAI